MSVRRRKIAARIERNPQLLERLKGLKSRMGAYLRWRRDKAVQS